MSRSQPIDWGLLVIRVGFAGLLIGFHGWARLLRATHLVVLGEPWGFVDLVARLGFPLPIVFAVLSAVAESVGALMVGLGVYARAAAFVVAGNMAVALANELAGGDPIELPGLYFLIAIALVLTGPGRLVLPLGRRRG